MKIITQGAAGSGPDVITRIVADHLGKRWGQQVLIFNHAGAGGVLAGRAAATADADGYTLYLPTITTFVIMPEIQKALPFDLDRDFTPIGFVAETPMMIAVSPSLGVRSLPELIALATARPGELFYAANNRGSLPHLDSGNVQGPNGSKPYLCALSRRVCRTPGSHGRSDCCDRRERRSAFRIGTVRFDCSASCRFGCKCSKPSRFTDCCRNGAWLPGHGMVRHDGPEPNA